MKIQTTILVEPVAKGRPRMAVVNGHSVAYTPEKTRNSEAEIRYAIRQALTESFRKDVPVCLEAIFYRQRPKSLLKRVTLPTTRPDLDNYLKTLLDALNGFAFIDDAQVTTIKVSKIFALTGETPRIELWLSEDK